MSDRTMTHLERGPARTALDKYLSPFSWFEERASSTLPSWVFPLRKAGICRFAELGLPTPKHEDWRFTNVAPLAQLPFEPLAEPSEAPRSSLTIDQLPLADIPGDRLVFVDGHYSDELSRRVAHENGVTVTSLVHALEADSAQVRAHLGRGVGEADNAFAALNAAYFTDGAFIHVPAGKTLEAPVHLLFFSTCATPGAATHVRNLIVAERGSRATVIESYGGVPNAACVNNAVTEMVVQEGAAIEHCKLQDEAPAVFHLAALQARLERDARLTAHSIALGARLFRQNIHTVLDGEGIECVLNGLYLAAGSQLMDHHMVVDHAQPHCDSHEYFNGILAGRSRGVFHGRILVREHAQKTDAKQTNKNLLLSDDATIDTKPQLEIYADDVKCTHGATIGQLNPESIYYLRSRGIGLEQARRMLIHAFAGEIVERIQHTPLREELDRLVWDRLETNEGAPTPS